MSDQQPGSAQEESFISHLVELRDRLLRSLIASHNGLLYTLDRRAQAGAQAGVVGALLDGLAGTLARLCAIGHE